MHVLKSKIVRVTIMDENEKEDHEGPNSIKNEKKEAKKEYEANISNFLEANRQNYNLNLREISNKFIYHDPSSILLLVYS